MERHTERDRETSGGSGCRLSSLQRATQVLPEDPSQLLWVAGSRPRAGRLAMSQAWAGGGMVLEPSRSSCARQLKSPEDGALSS